MKIAVMGAGAVGNYYGAQLARAGHDVTLIGRPALVDAVNASGLRLESAAFSGQVAVRASISPAAISEADLILFCVKSGDTEQAGREMAAYVSSRARVVCLQNGVDNAERLASILQREVIAAVVYVAVEMAEAATVRHHGRGDLVIADSPESARLAEQFRMSRIPCEVSDRVSDALWEKLIINCTYNALSAISQKAYGELVGSEGVIEVMREAFGECVTVATALGISLSPSLWKSTLAISDTMAGQRSSTAQDLARGRASEIDHLNGLIVRRGSELGIPTPVNRTLLTIVHLLERRST
jgi:2-dehydropantoate 2-reductase